MIHSYLSFCLFVGVFFGSDSWDQILYIAMFGCEEYPTGYEFTTGNPQATCRDSTAFGWMAAFVLFVIAIVGAFVLPTVLIGVRK